MKENAEIEVVSSVGFSIGGVSCAVLSLQAVSNADVDSKMKINIVDFLLSNT